MAGHKVRVVNHAVTVLAGIVNKLSKYAKNRRSGQFVTWLLGVLIFFDDYANTLIVGNTMRPITDRLRISREKLAYIVDSTAAPVVSIALITTWIGYEVSLIDEALQGRGHIVRVMPNTPCGVGESASGYAMGT